MVPLIVVPRFIAWIRAPLEAAQKRRTGWLRFLPSRSARLDEQQTLRGCPACAALVPRRAVVCPYCRRTLPALAARG